MQEIPRRGAEAAVALNMQIGSDGSVCLLGKKAEKQIPFRF